MITSIDQNIVKQLIPILGVKSFSLYQPPSVELGDLCFFWNRPEDESLQRLNEVSCIHKWNFEPKGYVNIFLKSHFLEQKFHELFSFLKANLTQRPNTIFTNFDLQYCYARCHSILKYKNNIPSHLDSVDLNILSLDMRSMTTHLLRFETLKTDKKYVFSYLQKLSTLFNNVWNNAPSQTILRFIDERDKTKTTLHFMILESLMHLVDFILARIDMKVLEEIPL